MEKFVLAILTVNKTVRKQFPNIVFVTLGGPEKGRFELRSKITSWPS